MTDRPTGPPPGPSEPPRAPGPPAAPLDPPILRLSPRGFALRGTGLVISAVVAIAGIVAALVLGGSDEAKAAEVLLEAAPSLGQDPFVDIDTQPEPQIDAPPAQPTSPPPAPQVQGPNGYVALYGGSGVLSRCYRDRLIAFLETHPTHAAAWASVAGIEPDGIGTYVRNELHALTLNVDLRVTNHGLINGVAAPFQSVLEAGTAVLVDAEGIPRVRCKCGNPLKPAVPVRGTPVYVGTPWPSFDPGVLVSIGVEDDDPTPIETSTGGYGDITGPPIEGTYEFGSARFSGSCEDPGDPDELLGDLLQVELPVDGIVVFTIEGNATQAEIRPDGTFRIVSNDQGSSFLDLDIDATGRLGGGRLEFTIDFGSGCVITLPATIIG